MRNLSRLLLSDLVRPGALVLDDCFLITSSRRQGGAEVRPDRGNVRMLGEKQAVIFDRLIECSSLMKSLSFFQ